ncbi:Fe(3+) dicitrate transport protein FecA [BD1-7 clade bacterium]|uniref:Fe(3+) dicitrate transport protein FecA n=1 Tax=BD1-7 clade bacterium TaxID=2029982 RepID=A0A5S9PKY4_9GAMM|nr:Fe(3+) dicitrate transport protein FecA [BD1-7 clade bacterium]
MFYPKGFSLLTSCALSMCISQVFAAETTIEEVIVEAKGNRSVEKIRAQRFSESSATTVIDLSEKRNSRLSRQSDVLKSAPGVVSVPNSAGNESAISIRGSDISLTARNRGVKVFVDGTLINFGGLGASSNLIDLQSMKAVEVMRGGNGSLYSAGSAGGSIYYHGFTGRDISAPLVRIEVGSSRYLRLQAAAGQSFDQQDYYVSVSSFRTDGYREHEAERQFQLSANYGFQLTPQINNRTFVTLTDSQKQYAGRISRATWNADPYSSNPDDVAIDKRKAEKNITVGNRFSWLPTRNSALNIGMSFVGGSIEGLVDRFQGIIDDKLSGYTLSPTYQQQFVTALGEHYVSMGFHYSDQEYHLNAWDYPKPSRRQPSLSGYDGYTKLARTQNGVSNLSDWDLFIQDRWRINAEWQLTVGVQKNNFNRTFNSRCRACAVLPIVPTKPPYDYKIDHSKLNYQLALAYFFSEQQHLYISHASSSNFASMFELNGMLGWVDPSSLNLQNAVTSEVGYKFFFSRLQGEVVLYNMNIDGEYTTEIALPPLPKRVLVNIGDTVHRGVELGVNYQIIENYLNVNFVYNWMNFYFDDHPIYGKNSLPRTPKHTAFMLVIWQPIESVAIVPSLQYIGKQTATYDLSGGRLYTADGYTLFNLRIGYQPLESLSVYVDGRNLLGENYIAAVGSQPTEGAISPGSEPRGDMILPGQPRNVYMGMEYRF